MTNDESQKHFLEQVRNGERPIPPSLLDAIADFLIGASIRWWNHWNKTDATGILPGVEEVRAHTKHHAIMIHLSRLKEHQLIAREIVEKAWREVKDEWGSFDLDTSPEEHLFKRRWTNQKFRTSRLLPNRPHMPYSQLEHFVNWQLRLQKSLSDRILRLTQNTLTLRIRISLTVERVACVCIMMRMIMANKDKESCNHHRRRYFVSWPHN